MHNKLAVTLALAASTACLNPAFAATGKLLLTGGVSSIEGAAGGGITPWAVIGSNGTDDQVGASAYVTRAVVDDYALSGFGAAVGFKDRFEVSLARQDFDAGASLALNGIAPFGIKPGQHIKMDILGLKARIAGDAVLDSDTLMPQIAVGLQYKSVHPGSLDPVLNFLGTKQTGTDFYVSATKLFLAKGLLVNGTLRATKANQNGLLGFGAASPGKNSYSLQPEFSVAYLISKNIAVGAEYRFKPNNLEALGRAAGLGDALREDDWKDIFIAWAPSKNLSFTLAYVDLGRIVPGITQNKKQTGIYLSTQIAF